MKTRFRLLVILSAITAFGGCATRSKSPFASLPPVEARALSRQMTAARERALQADLAEVFAKHRPRNVLVLSGGDSAGAYGCGILNGWRDAPTASRPTFDVVTGVSTGALMATAAFLGEAEDDRSLGTIYTTIHDKDVFAGPFTPDHPGSIFDTQPLERLIAHHINGDVLRRVAAAHRAGRRLYVATVGLDQGRLVIWPLSKIAADAFPTDGACDGKAVDAALARYRRILLATAAIPMMFPPVEIDGDLHVDAGLREAMFLSPEMLGSKQAAAESPEDITTVYAIVNGKIGGEPEVVENDLMHIGVRSLELYTDSLVLMSLRNVGAITLGHGSSCRFRYLMIPHEIDTGPGPSLFTAMFNPKITQRLYAEGVSTAKREKSPWHEGLPRLDGDAEPPAQVVAGH